MCPVTEADVLRARETRARHASSLSRDMDAPVVLVKANMPGKKKNSPYARVIINVATRLLFDLCDVTLEARTPSSDGDYHIMVVKGAAKGIKRLSVYLENTHRLGRLFDIDVYAAGEPLSRKDLGLQRRRCLICEGDVDVCRRLERHPMNTLHASIQGKVHGFLLDALSETAADALRRELYMTPCFSLVGPCGSGRHRDMNMSHFLASIEALKPYFRLYLSHGMDLHRNLPRLRELGKAGEKAMLDSTGGVNTHKGAHFIFGLVLPVFMHSVLYGEDFETFKDTLSQTAGYLLAGDFKRLKQAGASTRGGELYLEHGVKGVRGEALGGFKSVFEWYPERDTTDFEALLRIMARLEDTTLYKGSFDPDSMKKAFKTCEQEGFEGKDELYEDHRHLSPGGAADMLALVYFLRASDHLL